MSDSTFETLLTGQLREYADAGVRPIDRYAIAEGIISHSIAAGTQQRGRRWRALWPSGVTSRTPLVAALLLVGLLIALMAVMLLPGARPLLPAVVEPTASATTGPVGVPAEEPPIASPAEFPSASSEPVPGQGVMTRVADMTEGRIEPVMVTLKDGRVLMVGGLSYDVVPDVPAEIFDPSTGRFVTVTTPDSVIGDGSGSGVLLRDGRVLVVLYSGNHLASSIHVFDPQAMTWTRVTAKGFEGNELDGSGPIRRYPTLTLLRDGRVLLSGGEVNSPGGGTGTVVDTAEIFDPVTGTLSPTGSMTKPRTGHSTTLLPDGRVLVAGGRGLCDTIRDSLRFCDLPDLQDAEIYDPATGTSMPTGPMSGVRGVTEGMLLPDGRVLVLSISLASRSDGTDGPGLAEIYDPASGTFAAAASTPHGARTATLLPDGRVFLTAPWEELPATNDQTGPFTIWSGIYDPATGLTQDGPAPPAGRQQPALLADGRILLVGGEVNRRPLDGPPDSAPWAELYEWR